MNINNEPKQYVTKSGRVLTDVDFKALADQCENDPVLRAKVQEAVDGLEREGRIERHGDGYRVPGGGMDSFLPPNVDSNAVDRGVVALCRFVFPGAVVPRREMARAVLIAAAGGDDWLDYLPEKQIVRSEAVP